MKKLYFLIVVASIFLSSCNLSLNKEAKIIEREAIYREFINALNTSDSNIIKSKIIKHWSDTLIGKENRWLRTDMNYWLATNKEFGDLTFINYAIDSYNGNPVSWFQGDFTKDWIGLEFDFNNENKITGTNVLRSCLPTNSAALLNSDSLRVQSKNLHFYFSKLIEQDLFSGMVLLPKEILFCMNTTGDKKIKSKINQSLQIVKW
ncbi:hypothetical protein BFP77_01835 [Maribacter sp. 4U21]|uniref:hypothetical protein n=1 Tax=Maribacter sp. 4U21 TaxID=1889779 RepID=UPI000C158404|nr:hypothetical protein [Maribacter sp. 4U21]PIB31333.1 hypothetical protein BFP77_01835 [Maribacter sp. 4U21]